MTELSQKILDEYQVRKNKKQKEAFIELLQAHYPEMKIQTGGLIKCRNLVIGDVENAKTVLSAHYDTCARLIIPNFIAPKNVFVSLLYSMGLILPMIVILLLLNFPISLLTNSFMVKYWVTLLAAICMMGLMIAGPANKHNANDNTSGVVLLLEVLSRLTPQQREETAIVFFDNEEIGLLGSSLFKKRYAKLMENKLLINFDCVADGDHFMIALSKDAKKKYATAMESAFQPTEGKTVNFALADKVFYPSDHIGFPVAAAVAAFHKKKFVGFYVSRIHTAIPSAGTLTK